MGYLTFSISEDMPCFFFKIITEETFGRLFENLVYGILFTFLIQPYRC